MTTFTLTGPRGDQTVSMTWTDGELSGDPDAIAMVQLLAQGYEGHSISLTGTHRYTHHDHLSDPYSACAIMRSVFSVPWEIRMTEGGLPPLSPPPEGAVP